MVNLIIHEPDIDKIDLMQKIHMKWSINLNDSKSFTEYANDMDDIYKNIEENSQKKKQKTLIVFDDMVVDMLSNKKLNPLVTELFIREEN